MGYKLREGLSYGVCAGQAVFLDLPADRYFCLSPTSNALFIALACKQPDEMDVSSLIHAHVIEPKAGNSDLRAVRVPKADATLIDRPPRPVMTALSPLRFLDQIQIARGLGRHRLGSLLGRDQSQYLYERLKPGDCDLLELVGRFRSLEHIFTVKDRCLAQALLLRRCLARNGFGACLVFGVKLMPFQAHCWLQMGTTILSDHHDHVAEFTPVAAA